MSRKWYRVGEVAKRAGLTVRTLHHYDETGLLRPATHSPAGHRLYGVRELERLELILLYRQMGFSLQDVQRALDCGETDLGRLLHDQLAILSQRLIEQQRQLRRLTAIASRLEAGDILSAGDLMDTLEATAMFDSYFDPEQLEQLEKRRKSLPDDQLEQVQRDWKALFEKLDAARLAGIAASDGSLAPLADEASRLLAGFTGGEAGIAESLERMSRENTERMFEMWGISPELGHYYLETMKAHSS